MAKVTRNKIRKLQKLSNGILNKCTEKNFKIDKRSCDQKNIEYLYKKNVYPYGFDLKRNTIFFLETDSIIDNNNTGFFFEPLQNQAKYFIKVDLNDFYKLIKENEISDGQNILFIHHPGRCGSTLLHKIVGSSPQIESFSEDLILDNIFIYGNDNIEHLKRLCASLVTFIKDKWCIKQKKILSLKMTGYSRHYVEYLMNIFPSAKHVYLTREAVKIAESYINLMSTAKKFRIYRYLGVIYLRIFSFNILEKKYYGNLDYYFNGKILNKDIKNIRRLNIFEAFIVNKLINDIYYGYLSNDKCLMLQFNEIIDKQKIYKVLADFLELTGNNFDDSIFDRHSQSGSKFDASKIHRFKMSSKQKEKLALFEQYAGTLLR